MSEHRYRISRHNFITGAAGAAASASLLATLPPTIAQAALERKGSLDRIEHVVILMQENRSFDHYFGTMRGVRGFGDRAALRMNNNQDIFHQPDPLRPDGGFCCPCGSTRVRWTVRISETRRTIGIRPMRCGMTASGAHGLCSNPS
jgi:hypothetical protein